MDLTFSPSEAAFRHELRTWLALNPAGQEPESDEERFAWRRSWQARLAAGGWAGVHWPVEFGGRGVSVTESAIFFEELAEQRAPLPAGSLGLLLAGPTILACGTEAQKARYLEPILTGEEIWCQGFSEPDAGSDLAALKTRAVADGAEWVVSGQKVWTSWAQYSRRCMLLARTDPEGHRHHGLTYFLLDMDSPGIELRPLRQMTGEAHFNELFLDEVRIPQEAVLGGVGNGWAVAMTTLMNERSGLAFFWQVRSRQLFESLVEEAAARDLLADAVVIDRLGALDADLEALRLTAYRALTQLAKHGQPGPESSLTKLMWSRANQTLVQLAIDIVGPDALRMDSRWAYELLRARGNSIEGGTTEILKNIVAERVLGLPRQR